MSATAVEPLSPSSLWEPEVIRDLAARRRMMGMCWERPAEHAQPVWIQDFPLDRVAWWANPVDRATVGACDSCSADDPEFDSSDCDSSSCRIRRYADDLASGDQFPALDVIRRRKGDNLWGGKRREWLVDDGHHRLSAALTLGWTHFPAWVWDETVIPSLGASKDALTDDSENAL